MSSYYIFKILLTTTAREIQTTDKQGKEVAILHELVSDGNNNI